eukprot:1818424-Ditylum_brightwellii.AAC.1
MMSFVLNPYDNALDLLDKEGRKLFKSGCKGLEPAQQFDGRKEAHQIKNVRLAEVLETATEWDTHATVLKFLQTIINTFDRKDVTKEAMTKHVNLVWASIRFGGEG